MRAQLLELSRGACAAAAALWFYPGQTPLRPSSQSSLANKRRTLPFETCEPAGKETLKKHITRQVITRQVLRILALGICERTGNELRPFICRMPPPS